MPEFQQMGIKTYVNPAGYVLSSTITMGEASYFDTPIATYQTIKHQTAMSVMLLPLWETQISLANEPSGPLKQHFFRW
jgi:hypothetical protein